MKKHHRFETRGSGPVRGLAVATFLILAPVLFSGCDPAGSTTSTPAIVWLQPNGSVGGAVSDGPVHPKFDHRGPWFEVTHEAATVTFDFASSVSVQDPMLYLLVAHTPFGDSAHFGGHTVDIILLAQAQGDEHELTISGTVVSGLLVVIGDTSLASGLDFWDANGNGVFDDTIDSNDYPLICYKTITLKDGDGASYHTWTNPDL